jgi:hypothetical protein
MPQSLARHPIPLIDSAKNRVPCLSQELRPKLNALLRRRLANSD